MSVARIDHKFVSTKPDPPDSSLIGRTKWNDHHNFLGGVHGSLLMRDTTDTDYGASWLESSATGKVLVSLGSGSAPGWSATPSLTSLSLTVPLAVTGGGTGLSTVAVGDLLYANTTTTLARRAAVADGNVLRSAGTSTAPIWGKVRLSGSTTDITGTLAVANGGTGATTLTTNGVLYGNGTSAVNATSAGPINSVLTASGGAPSFSATPTVTRATATESFRLSAASGGALAMEHAFLHVPAVSGQGAITAAGLIPPGSLLFGVTTRVAVGFGLSAGLTAFHVGDGSDVDRFATGAAIALNSTTDLSHVTDTAPKIYTSLTNVVLTAANGTFDGTGEAIVTAYFVRLTAPTQN